MFFSTLIVLAMFVVSWRAGRPIVRACLDSDGMTPLLVELISLSVGTGILALGLFALAWFGGLNSAGFLLLGAGLALLGLAADRNVLSNQGYLKPSNDPSPAAVERPLLVFIAAVAALHWVRCAVPDTLFDSMVYHLHAPQQYLDRGRMVYLPTQMYSNLFLQTEILYLPAMHFGGETAVHMLHAAAAAASAGMIYAAARPILPKSGALTAAALYLSLPLVSIEAPTAAIDLFTPFFMLPCFLASRASARSPHRKGWIVAGLLFGFSSAAKSTSCIALAPLALLIWMDGFFRTRRKFAAAALFGLGAALPLVPWLMKNGAFLNSPFWPYEPFSFWKWEEGPKDFFANLMPYGGMGRSLKAAALLPFNLTFNEWGFAAPWSPVFLMYVPLLALFRKLPATISRHFSFSMAYVAAWFFLLPQDSRYLAPVLPQLCLLCAWPIDRLRRFAGPARVVSELIFAAVLAVQLTPVFTGDSGLPKELPFLTGKIDRENYLASSLPQFRAFQWINAHRDPGDAAFLDFSFNQGYGLDGTVYVGHGVFQEEFDYEKIGTAPALDARFEEKKIRYLFFRKKAFDYLEPNPGDNPLSGAERAVWREYLRSFVREAWRDPEGNRVFERIGKPKS